MSRLNQIIENHENLNQLFSILKHYGINAEFVSSAILHQFEDEIGTGEDEKKAGEDEKETGENEKETGENENMVSEEFIEDLSQFEARF